MNSHEQPHLQAPQDTPEKRGSITTPRVDANDGVQNIGDIPIHLHSAGWVRIKQKTDGKGMTWLEIEIEETQEPA